MPPPEVIFAVTADGRTVAEALVAGCAEAESLLAADGDAGSDVAWAHSTADLSELGFSERCGYRKMQGRSGRRAGRLAVPADPVVPLSPHEESAEICAEAFSGQWGHKTPAQWPLDLPAGTITLGLRRDGRTVGICRIQPDTGLIDAPGLIPAHRDTEGYKALLVSALAAARAPLVTVESWGDPADRLKVCERLELTTAEYVPGWEFSLRR